MASKKKITETAADSLHPGTHPVDDPKTRLEYISAMIGAANCLQDGSLQKWFEQSMALIGHEADQVPGNADANKATLTMKPSAAVGGTAAPLPDTGPAQLPQTGVEGLQEAELTAMFEGETLSEAAQTKIATLFEAAVQARVGVQVANVQDKLLEATEIEYEEFLEEQKHKLGQYIDYAVEQWVNENQVAITNALRLEIAESFFGGMKALMREHNVDIPDEKVDIAEDLRKQVAVLEAKLNEKARVELETIAEAKKLNRGEVLAEVATEHGLTLMDKGRLSKLVENIEFTDREDFKGRINLVRETYFSKQPKVKADVLSEEFKDEEVKKPSRKSDNTLVEAATRLLNRPVL